METTKKIKSELKSLVFKLKTKQISIEEGYLVFETIINDLSNILGEDNSDLINMKQNFHKVIFRPDKINELKQELNYLKQQQYIIDSNIGLI